MTRDERTIGEAEAEQRGYERGRAEGGAEIERLRAALRGCVAAHETGQYEPARIAYECARAALAEPEAGG